MSASSQRQLTHLQTRARKARSQADRLWLALPFDHPLSASMLRITHNWLRIEKLCERLNK